MSTSTSEPLEVYISSSGAYLGLNEAAAHALGYSATEIRELPLGTLSGSSREAAEQVWLAFVADGLPIAPNANVRLYAKDGRQLAVRFIGSERLDDERWVSRYRLLTGRAVATDQPFVLQALLAQWRELEGRVTALGADAADQVELVGQLEEIKALYQFELRRRRTPGDALP